MSKVFIDTTEKQPLIEKPKKERKQRAPLSEEKKEILRERLKKAREAKKLKQTTEPKVVKEKVKKEKVVKEKVVKQKEPVFKSEYKKINIIRHPQPKRVPKDTRTQELEDLRSELLLLKENGRKKEISDLKNQVNSLKEKNKEKKQSPAPSKVVKERSEPPVVPKEADVKKAVKNYSTYKKSIWSELAGE